MAAIMFSHEAFPTYRLALFSLKHFILLLGDTLKMLQRAPVGKWKHFWHKRYL